MTREAMKAMGVKVLDQEPCNDAAKERYEDLCEYFGEAKDILKNREDFKAWLGRVKWHIHKAEELSAENDDLRDQLAMRDRFQKQQSSGNTISRKEAIDALWEALYEYDDKMEKLTPQPKTGHWVKYGKPRCDEQHYKCTACDYYINFGIWGDIYTKQFNYCPNCGARMIEPQESEGKE